MATTKILVGAYTNSDNPEGIIAFNFDTETLDFEKIVAAEVPNASYLAIDGTTVYACNETGDAKDTLTSLNWDGQAFTTNNVVDAGGSAPCYIAVGPGAKHVFAANYSDGTLTAVAILPNGKLADGGQVITHTGSGPNADRQECAHMHCTEVSSDGKYLIASDLGTDTVTIYAYNAANTAAPLATTPTSVLTLAPGTGPRHIIFSADGRFAYLIGELISTVIVLAWDSGSFTKLQDAEMLTENAAGQNTAADIHFSADGNYLYASNRGAANQIVVFGVDKQTGLLRLAGRQLSNGNGPRNFAIHPDGELLLVAHQYTNDIRVFKIDKATGLLHDTGKFITVHAPVCIKFV